MRRGFFPSREDLLDEVSSGSEIFTSMAGMVAFVNGRFMPAETAAITIFDRGLRWGDAVYDVERTFRHEPFRLREHMLRLYRSVRYTRINLQTPIEEFEELVRELVRRNSPCIAPESDLEVVQIVTRGSVNDPSKPNVVMYCREEDWKHLADELQNGVRVVTPSVRRIPQQCLSPCAKTANKMSQMVAEHEARAVDPQARALMLDIYGNIAEEATSNFFFVLDGRLCTPSLLNCLPGISRMVTLELARKLAIPVEEGSFTVFDVYRAEEAFLTSTSPCIYGVTHINGLRIGGTFPGSVTQRLTQAWKETAGFDFVEQAVRFSRR